MKRNYLLLVLFLVVAFGVLDIKKVNSKVSAPPAGTVGDPVATATCVQSGCHGPNAPAAPVAGQHSLGIGTNQPTGTLNSSFAYTPGTTYNIAFSISATASTYGFEMTALKPDNTMAGSFAVISNVTNSLSTLSGRQYIGHKAANTTKNWVFKWTAPTTSTPVTFYYAYNLGNGNNASTGDLTYKNSFTINAATTAVEDITTKVADLNIFPNPITANFALSFNLLEANQVAAQLYNLNGQLVKELINEKMNGGNFNQQFDIDEVPAGIYVVKMNVGSASVSKKIIKL